MADGANDLRLVGLQMEYSTLRDEFLRRIEMRQKLMELTLTIAAAFLGISLTKEVPQSVALIYPPLATFLALGWVQQDNRIRELAKYIRKNLESCIPDLGLGWETHMEAKRRKKKEELNAGTGDVWEHGKWKSWRFVSLSNIGVVLITQLMAVIIGMVNPTTHQWSFVSYPPNPLLILFLLDLFFILITVRLLVRRLDDIRV
jgi:hypothetical protein